MGSAAAEQLEVLTGFIEEELEERRQLLALAQRAPTWARQKLRDMAWEEDSHARRLMAVYYLITGECYRPRVSCERICVERWCPALRERYHVQACSGLNYARAADETTDLCLQRLWMELSAEEYHHADRLLRILEKGLGR
jgi:rubrerythrin